MPVLCAKRLSHYTRSLSILHASDELSSDVSSASVTQKDLHVYVFVAFVGWGKNTMIDAILSQDSGGMCLYTCLFELWYMVKGHYDWCGS